MKTSPVVLFFLAVLVCGSWTVPANTFAQNVDKLEQRIHTLETEVDRLKQTLAKQARELELLKKTHDEKPAAENKGKKRDSVRVLVVAAERIPAYKTLQDKMVTFIEVPQSELLWDAVTRREDYEGKALNIELTRGEMITKSRLTDKFNASTEIPEGKVIVSITMNLLPTRDQPIQPGDKVDLFMSAPVENREGTKNVALFKVKRLFSQVEIYAIDSEREPSKTPADRDNEFERRVSMFVDSDQASPLIMAEEKGTLILGVKN